MDNQDNKNVDIPEEYVEQQISSKENTTNQNENKEQNSLDRKIKIGIPLAIALILFLIVGISRLGNNKAEEDKNKDCITHSYGEWYKDEPCSTLEWKDCNNCDKKDFRVVDAGHVTNNNGVCINCGKKITYTQEEVKNIIQIQFFNLGEYDGGALKEIKIVFKNTSEKEIDEIFFGVTGYYNGESDVHRCTYPGNVKPGAVAGNGHYYEPLWPSEGMYGVKISSIVIIYTDGTEERIFDDNVNLAFWSSSEEDTNKESNTNEEILDSGYPNLTASRGLKYSDYGNGVSVSGIGTCTDKEIVIPEKYNGKVVLAIGEFAFRDNTVITKVTFPKTLTSIEKFAFDGCTSIKSIIIPDNVTKIGSYAFSDCNSLEEIVLPFVGNSSTGEGATSNYDKNFGFIFGSGSNSYVPESLKKVTVTKGRVAAGSFRGCSSLETIILPDGLQEIGDRTFQSCTSLKNIIIPESVKTIGEFAFSDCKSLIEIDIPKSITLLQRCSFYGCRNLVTINYNDDKDAWKAIQKEDSWDDLVPFNGCSYMIVCTNGIIEVNN